MVPEIGSLTDRIFYHLTIFCPFNPLTISIITAQKIKIKKKQKNAWRYTKNCTKNYDHMLYCSWDMVHDRCNFYFSFWAIFYSFTPLTAQKIKIYKKIKKCLEIPSFYIVRNRLTDQQTKKVKYRGGCPIEKSVLKS